MSREAKSRRFSGIAKTRDAVERCLARISEAAVKLGAAAEDLAPDQPWRGIRDLGNVLRHAYDEIEPMRIWRLVMDDLPALKTACQTALERVRHEDQA